MTSVIDMTRMTQRFLVGFALALALLMGCTSPAPSPTLTDDELLLGERRWKMFEELRQDSLDLVRWNEEPTIRRGRLTFSGSLQGGAVLNTETNEQAQSAISPGNFSFMNFRTRKTGVVMRRPDGGDGFILN